MVSRAHRRPCVISKDGQAMKEGKPTLIYTPVDVDMITQMLVRFPHEDSSLERMVFSDASKFELIRLRQKPRKKGKKASSPPKLFELMVQSHDYSKGPAIPADPAKNEIIKQNLLEIMSKTNQSFLKQKSQYKIKAVKKSENIPTLDPPPPQLVPKTLFMKSRRKNWLSVLRQSLFLWQ